MMKNSSYFNEANDAAGNNHTAPTDHGDEKISFACRTLNTFGSKKAKRILPLDFHPNDFTVIVGRGADATDLEIDVFDNWYRVLFRNTRNHMTS